MELALLRSFVALAEQENFGRAAKLLCMTQPTLSKQLLRLENRLGMRLFERGRHGAQLTALGALFLPDARRLIKHADETLHQLRRAARGERGRLRIGFGLSSLEFVPQAIAGFCQGNPDVDITLNDYSSQEQAQRLICGELEIGFVRLPSDPALTVLPLFAERLALVVPAASPWRVVPDDLDELNATGFIALTSQRGPGLAAQVRKWCAAQRFAARVTQYCEDIQTVLAVVSAGLGVALLPCRAGLLLPQRVRVLPLPRPNTEWQIGLAWHGGRENPGVRRFVEFIERVTSSSSPGMAFDRPTAQSPEPRRPSPRTRKT